VTVTETLAGQWWAEPQTEEARLRFIDPRALETMLAAEGYVVESQYGDWRRGPFTEHSEELVTIARVG